MHDKAILWEDNLCRGDFGKLGLGTIEV